MLYDSMTVIENLLFTFHQSKEISKNEKMKLLKDAFDNVCMADVKNKMLAELLGGMRKRIGLASTLILKPEIMLFYEPTKGLDPITASEISELMFKN